MPCTTLLVGKNATYDGSTMMACNEDSGAGSFTPKKFITVNPEDQPRHYRSVLSAFEIELTETPCAIQPCQMPKQMKVFGAKRESMSSMWP